MDFLITEKKKKDTFLPVTAANLIFYDEIFSGNGRDYLGIKFVRVLCLCKCQILKFFMHLMHQAKLFF